MFCLRSSLTFHANADPGAKCCKMRKKWREIPHYKPATDDSRDSCKHISWLSHKEKISCTKNYLHTFHSLYYFLRLFFVRKSLWFRNFIPSSVKCVSWSDHSNVNKPLHKFHFSHVFVLQTHFADFLRVACSRLYTFHFSPFVTIFTYFAISL